MPSSLVTVATSVILSSDCYCCQSPHSFHRPTPATAKAKGRSDHAKESLVLQGQRNHRSLHFFDASSSKNLASLNPAPSLNMHADFRITSIRVLALFGAIPSARAFYIPGEARMHISLERASLVASADLQCSRMVNQELRRQ